MSVILVGGGVRSGKSRFALVRARELALATTNLTFIATAQPLDEEMRERIAIHRRDRGTDIETIEEPLDLIGALAARPDRVVLIDCLTLWLSNLLLRGDGAAEVEREIARLATALDGRNAPTLVVSNEVGMGIVPETPLGRLFRDLSGHAHQRLAAVADEIFLATLGVVLRLRPGPVALVTI